MQYYCQLLGSSGKQNPIIHRVPHPSKTLILNNSKFLHATQKRWNFASS